MDTQGGLPHCFRYWVRVAKWAFRDTIRLWGNPWTFLMSFLAYVGAVILLYHFGFDADADAATRWGLAVGAAVILVVVVTLAAELVLAPARMEAEREHEVAIELDRRDACEEALEQRISRFEDWSLEFECLGQPEYSPADDSAERWIARYDISVTNQSREPVALDFTWEADMAPLGAAFTVRAGRTPLKYRTEGALKIPLNIDAGSGTSGSIEFLFWNAGWPELPPRSAAFTVYDTNTGRFARIEEVPTPDRVVLRPPEEP